MTRFDFLKLGYSKTSQPGVTQMKNLISVFLVLLSIQMVFTMACKNPNQSDTGTTTSSTDTSTSWGESTVEGYVLTRYIYPDGRILVEQVENVIISTDSGNEATLTDADGWYSLNVLFVVDQNSNTKNIILSAEREDIEEILSSDEILLVDGQSTLAPTMYWEVTY